MTLDKLVLYTMCFQGNENRFTQFTQSNLMCGSHTFSSEYRDTLKEKSFLFDDTHDNISTMNKWMGDLTGLYWVWKNTNDEFVGVNQYRRKWLIREDLKLSDNTLYVTSPLRFHKTIKGEVVDETLYGQYRMCHTDIGIRILKDAVFQKRIDIPQHVLDLLDTQIDFYPFNMFFTHRDVFNKVCEVLFEILFELYNGTRYLLPYVQPSDQTRMLAFLSERLLSIMYTHHNYFFGTSEVVPVMWKRVDK